VTVLEFAPPEPGEQQREPLKKKELRRRTCRSVLTTVLLPTSKASPEAL